jgi:putative hemolysin
LEHRGFAPTGIIKQLKRTKIRGCLRVPVWEIERHEKELERERRCNPFHLQQRAAAPFNSQTIEPGQVRDIVLGRETFFLKKSPHLRQSRGFS